MTTYVFFPTCVFRRYSKGSVAFTRMLLNCACVFCHTIWHFPADGSFVRHTCLSKLISLSIKKFKAISNDIGCTSKECARIRFVDGIFFVINVGFHFFALIYSKLIM